MRFKSYTPIIFIIIIFMLFIALSGRWITHCFGHITYKQLLFHFKMSFNGVNYSIILDIAKHVILPILILSIIYLICSKISKIRSFLLYPYLCLLFVFSVIDIFHYWDFYRLYKESKIAMQTGNFYEQNYIFPKKENIIFPDKKKNLIFIILESMEATFSQKELVGSNLTPNLSKLAKENISFGDGPINQKGITQLYSTGWTIAGIFSHTCGIPLDIPISSNNINRRTNNFFGNLTCMGDILKAGGYHQIFLIPHNKDFSGLGDFAHTHGDIEVRDLAYFKKKGLPKDYEGYWGIKDWLNLQYAKDTLNELSNSSKPFALYILSIDTHTTEGYVDPKNCPLLESKTPKMHYENALRCTDMAVDDFISWLKKQSFYKDTTIVIVGDHISMSPYITLDHSKRRVYNAYINAHFYHPIKKTNRQISHFDTFPTTLDALNINIKGSKLGLGTDLGSEAKTLLEHGYDENEIKKHSRLYDTFIFHAKDTSF